MEIPTKCAEKKKRAPKVSKTQMEYLISYMESHDSFATGKFLGVRGKATHDILWQQLTTKLNELNGPSKSVEGWKKVWSDQKNYARARAAKEKAQQRLTGNIGEVIELKDSDLRILSIIGAESALGLPIRDAGLPKQDEDTMDPSLLLGITEDINETPNDVFSIKNVDFVDSENILENLAPADIVTPNIVSRDIYTDEQSSGSKCNVVSAKRPRIDTSQKAKKRTLEETLSHLSSNIIPANIASRDIYTDEQPSGSKCNVVSAKRPRIDTSQKAKKPSLGQTISNITSAQDEQNEISRAIADSLKKIAFAVTYQNQLLEKSITLHEKILDMLSKSLNYITEHSNINNPH